MSVPIRSLRILCALAAGAAIGAIVIDATAQTMAKRKPGLWEMEMKSPEAAAAAAQMQQQLAKMPADQRAMMEKMMKGSGMQMAPSGEGMKVRHCVTEAQASEEQQKGAFPRDNGPDRCERTIVSRSATELRFKAVCKQPDGDVVTSEGRVYDVTPERMSMDIKSTSAKTGERQMQQTMRWISADCGAVK